MTSPQIHDFVDVVVNLDQIDRERFVKFITGSNRLPHGGFAALDPPLTVVKATRDDGYADSFLPSVMTCANFLKLPEYSNRDIMQQQILKAIREGQGSFLLS
jgi:E3 ubiquitin-protein ligase TRIP12